MRIARDKLIFFFLVYELTVMEFEKNYEFFPGDQKKITVFIGLFILFFMVESLLTLI